MVERNSWEDYRDVRKSILYALNVLTTDYKSRGRDLQAKKAFLEDDSLIDRSNFFQLRTHYKVWSDKINGFMGDFNIHLENKLL